jgi:signal transduction histidine kinase
MLTVAGVVAQLWVLYLFAAQHSRRTSLLVALPFLLIALIDRGFWGILLGTLAVTALTLGDARRLRAEAIDERDASRRELADTRRDQAILDERARIARELHDVVAHHVSAIAVQAEVARLASPGLSAEAQDRLRAIGDTAREALTEMRQLLGVLRSGDDSVPERAPQPGLADLPELIVSARASGTDVGLTVRGDLTPLPAAGDLAGYRILQEALANARRHAPGADVRIDLAYTPEAVTITVADDGPGAGANVAEGHGLLGMRERVAMLGGTLQASTRRDGGFVVVAMLPVEPPAR